MGAKEDLGKLIAVDANGFTYVGKTNKEIKIRNKLISLTEGVTITTNELSKDIWSRQDDYKQRIKEKYDNSPKERRIEIFCSEKTIHFLE